MESESHLCMTCGKSFSSLDKLTTAEKNFDIAHGYFVKHKQGTAHHLLKSLQSLSSYNSLRVGTTPPQDFTLRKKTPNSTPKQPPKKWVFSNSLLERVNDLV